MFLREECAVVERYAIESTYSLTIDRVGPTRRTCRKQAPLRLYSASQQHKS